MKLRYRFRMYPTLEQEAILSQVFGHSRFVYNWGLRLRTDAHANGEKVNYNASSAALTQLKKTEGYEWLNDVSCVPLQQSLRHLQTSFKNFFDKTSKYPTFKRKHNKQSAEFTRSAFKYSDGVLSLARIGKLDVRWSREFSSKPTTVTVTKVPSGKYFVTLVLDEPKIHKAKTGKSVGVDLGINRLATLSDGVRIPNPRFTKRYQTQLAKAQRDLSRKTKGSGRWQRQRVKVARIHEKIVNSRLDHLHKVTTNLVNCYDVIAVEDLNVRGMVKNRKLAKHISDASFSQFVALLEYKCDWYGKELRKLDRWFPSSKRCNACGHTVAKLPLSVREWTCEECSHTHDRDENAARNIKDFAAGQVVSRGE